MVDRVYNSRIHLKGATETDEHLKLVCEIRHKYTNYEKLAVFYNIRPQYRSQLNAEITRLIQKGPDGVDKFREKIKKLEYKVNLNNKESRKQFVKEEIANLKRSFPYATDNTIKKSAEQIAIDYIRANNEYIHKHKLFDNTNPE